MKVKCERYYPRNRPDENVLSFNGFRITLLEKEYAQLKQAQGEHNLVRRKLKLEDTKSGDSRIVHHFQYTEWPDHGLPAAGTLGFRELLHMVDSVNGVDYSPKPPIIVHCRYAGQRSDYVIANSADQCRHWPYRHILHHTRDS